MSYFLVITFPAQLNSSLFSLHSCFKMANSKPLQDPDLLEVAENLRQQVSVKYYLYKKTPDALLLEQSIGPGGLVTRHIPLLKIRAGDRICKVCTIFWKNAYYLYSTGFKRVFQTFLTLSYLVKYIV